MAPEIFKKSEFSSWARVACLVGVDVDVAPPHHPYAAACTNANGQPAAGHGKPVDVWAMGVITYFLLCGACLLVPALAPELWLHLWSFR